MRKHSKPGGGNPHPHPKGNNAQGEERSISGNVHVRGEVIVELGPKEADARNSSEIKEDARKLKTWRLEVATFIVLSIYAGLTALQACESSRAVTVAQEANQLTLESVRARLIIPKLQFTKPISVGDHIEVTSEIKNIGRSTAFYGIKWDIKRWRNMPDGSMPIADPLTDHALEPEVTIPHTMIEGLPVSQAYLDGLPTAEDIFPGAYPHETTYFFGKLIYGSIGPNHEIDFCLSVMKANSFSRSIDVPGNNGDPNYILSTCPKWNGTYDKPSNKNR